MGHEEHGDSGVAPELANQALHVFARAGIESAEGFVHEQNPRLRDQRLGDGDALLHASGELVGILAGVAFAQADAANIAEALPRGTARRRRRYRGVKRVNRLNSLTSGPKVMLSSTVLSGNSEYFCGT